MNKLYSVLFLFTISLTASSQQRWSWTWIGGDKASDAAGIYGSQGVSLPLNIPGSRTGAATWTDDGGNFWLFGGIGKDKNGETGYLGDLWKFNPLTNQWTWMGGADIINQYGRYGNKEIGSLDNQPGARQDAVAWTDRDGNFWLFGGLGMGAKPDEPKAPEGPGRPDDGPKKPGSPGKPDKPGNQQGEGEDKEDKEKEKKDKKDKEEKDKKDKKDKEKEEKEKDEKEKEKKKGKKDDDDGKNKGRGKNSTLEDELTDGEGLLNDLWMYSPATGQWTWISGERGTNLKGNYGQRATESKGKFPGSRYQSSGWIDDQNNLWLFGGRGYASEPRITDMNDLWKFSLSTKTWTWMNDTSTDNMSPTGRRGSISFIDNKQNFWLFGGGTETDLFNDVWKYQPALNSWQQVQATADPGARMLAEGWGDDENNLFIFGGYGGASDPKHLNNVWKYSIDANEWKLVSGESSNQPIAVYGTRGAPSENNHPGGTSGAACWKSNTGSIYVFGGRSSEGYSNTAWKLAPIKENVSPPADTKKVAVPTAFTPNGNSMNDVLRPLGELSSLDFFRIYNRWGKIMFQTNVIGNGWDGKFGGLVQPAETYTWLLSGKTTDGQPVKLSGKTVLIR